MSTETSENYEALCKIYDSIMNCVAYDLWCKLIIDICKKEKYGTSAKILEFGGGTGILGKKLKESGFDYQGSDISLGMAKEAKRKNLDFVCADIRNIPFREKFDLLIFLFDGINYIFDIKEFTKTFEQAYSVLKDNACFLFDITTEVNSTKNFLNYREASSEKEFAYIRESYYSVENRVQHNDFEIFMKKENEIYIRSIEKHRQKIHTVESVIKSIPQNLFIIEGIYGDFNRKRYTQNSERVHFLLRKRRLES